IFKELSYVFIAAVLGGMLAWRLRQPLILGYVFAGILISPFTPGPAIHEAHTFELLAEVGVIFLMFTVGLEFSVKELLRVKGIALLGGSIGIAACGLMGLGVGALLGWGLLPGLAVGLVISVASTMVMSRLLIDRGELQSEHGRVMIAITLVEDLGTVILIIVLPLLANFTPSHLIALAKQLGLAALVLVPLVFLAKYLVPRLLAVISRMCSDEIFLLVTLAVCLGAAAITQAVGLSLAIGAFVGGLTISGSEHAHRALERLMPLRDAFVALFFVTVGTLINPRGIFANIGILLVVVGMVVVGKALIWTGITKAFGYSARTSILVGTGLTQIGEFSFILVQAARNSGLLTANFYHATLAASLITILINAALVRSVPNWLALPRRRQRGRIAA
ncbi:MAG: cation:proton antiporter, partial [Candidatus Korobacteraceae bacterium]